MSGDADVLVVGGGLSGLALAASLVERGRRVRLLEAAAEVGGNLRTRRVETAQGPWMLDLGPNSFGGRADAFVGLARRVGLGDRIVRAPQTAGRRFLWRDGRLRDVPSNPLRFLASGAIPVGARLRLLAEPFVARRPADAPEETLAAFCNRRLGRVVREKLVSAVVGGIYAGDPEELGAQSAFPALTAMERAHGSLVRAALRGAGPPSRGRLGSFADGFGELPRAVRARLGDAVTTNSPARRVVREGGLWRVETDDRAFAAARLVVAAPAPEAASLLASTDAAAAAELAAIPYAPMAVVHVGVRADGVSIPDGFGFLVPRNEGLRILGAVFSSSLFPGRAPPGHVLLAVFVGGRLDVSAAALDDAALRALVLDDLSRALRLVGGPALVEITRWPRAVPQYVVGHEARVARIDAAVSTLPSLSLLGNWKGGIGVEDCARNAAAQAASIAD